MGCCAAEGSSTPTKSEEQLQDHEHALHGGKTAEVVGEPNSNASKHSMSNSANGANGNAEVRLAPLQS